MDDEREIRDGLDRIAGELPPAGRPPQRFRHRARRRMAVSGALVGLVALALIGGSVAGLQALDLGKESGPGGVTTSVTTAASPASPAPSSPAAGPPIEHIAFQSDRSGNDDVWVMDENGDDPIDLTNDPAADQMPAWSPDGTKIAFASDRTNPWWAHQGGDIYVMNADGSGMTQLTDTGDPETAPAWSPDGGWIAYERFREPGGGSPEVAASELWLMRADGSDQHPLTEAAYGFRIAWSPDGSEIAFTRTGGLATISRDGGQPHPIRGGENGYDPSWCPDGRPIVFVRGEKRGDLWLVDPAGGAPSSLTGDGLAGTPAWNARGTAVVFAMFADTAPVGRAPASGLVLIGLAGSVGGQLTDITPGVHDVWPAWQPVAT